MDRFNPIASEKMYICIPNNTNGEKTANSY